MKRKSIIDQVEELEARKKDAEKNSESIKSIFVFLAVIVMAIIVGGGIFIYKYLQPTEAELAYKAEQKREHLLNNARFDTCEVLIKRELNNPSSYKIKSRATESLESGVYVHISFTAKNDFGAELPQSGQCVETSNGMVFLGIKNR